MADGANHRVDFAVAKRLRHLGAFEFGGEGEILLWAAFAAAGCGDYTDWARGLPQRHPRKPRLRCGRFHQSQIRPRHGRNAVISN